MELTNRQLSIIIGSMLGDGSLENRCRNACFREKHGIKQQDWLKWKESELQPFSSRFTINKTTARKRLADSTVIDDTTRTYQSCNFATISHLVFTELEKVWYKRNEKGEYVFKLVGKHNHRIKIVPEGLYLDKLSLAVWFLDDGCNRPTHRECIIYSLGFTFDETSKLLDNIKLQGFNECNIGFRNKHQCYIRISGQSYVDFIRMIKEQMFDIPECMKYKISLSEYKAPYACWEDKLCRNEHLLASVTEDANNKMTQVAMAKKYGVGKQAINDILRGKTTLTRNNSTSSIQYNNTTGISNFHFSKRRGCERYIGYINIVGTRIYLGQYKNKKTAALASKEANILKTNGCVELAQYEAIKSRYCET